MTAVGDHDKTDEQNGNRRTRSRLPRRTRGGARPGHGGRPPGHFDGTQAVVIIYSLLQGLLIRRAINPDLVPDQLIEDAFSLLFSAFITNVVDPDEALKIQAQRERKRKKS